MARVTDFFKKSLLPAENTASYQSIPPAEDDYSEGETQLLHTHKVSAFEYGVFMLLGVAM